MIGGFQLVEPLGQTSRFSLWRARRDGEDDGAELLLKTAHLGRDRELLGPLTAKIAPALALRGQALVRLSALGIDGDTLFIAGERVLGRDLSQLLGGRCHQRPAAAATGRDGRWPTRTLPLPLALAVAQELCDALAQGHEQLGRAHGELCPWHVMVSFGGQVKLLDCGLAPLTSRLKVDGIAESWGTFRYAAPEQLGGAPIDGRADLYALALVLYELITGRPWIEGDADASLLQAHAGDRSPSLEALGHLPDDVAELLVSALSSEPERRFASAVEMGRALDGVRRRRDDPPPSAAALSRHMWRTFQQPAAAHCDGGALDRL